MSHRTYVRLGVMPNPDADELCSPGEAALILRRSTKTVVRWGEQGKLQLAEMTEGGHRRFHKSDVLRLRDELIGAA
jgi:excisionase family DNA binding protein